MSTLSDHPEESPHEGGEAPAASAEEELAIRVQKLGLSTAGGKKLLILDLNGLLVHAVFKGDGDGISVPNSRKPDFVVGRKYGRCWVS